MNARAYSRLRQLARRVGFDVVRADYYSPIPAGWRPDLWDRPSTLPGVDLRLDSAAELLRTLAPLIAQYAPPSEAPGTKHGFHHRNGMYPQIDAEILFAMVRHFEPNRIVEVGAGWSSRVIADALDGREVEHRIFDPFPADHVVSLGADIEAVRAEDIPAEVFAALSADDLLFIDTTHTVKPGNDVVRLILEVLPALAPGVVVHVHDIFLPYCYPEFMHDLGLHWQEQYVVQALLSGNPGLQVLMPNYALSRLRGDALEAAGLDGHTPGSALWLRRTAN